MVIFCVITGLGEKLSTANVNNYKVRFGCRKWGKQGFDCIYREM